MISRRTFIGQGAALGLALGSHGANARWSGPITWIFGFDGSASVKDADFAAYKRVAVASLLPLVQAGGDTVVFRRLEDPESVKTFTFGDALTRHAAEIEQVARHVLDLAKRQRGGSTLFIPATDFLVDQVAMHQSSGGRRRRRFVLALISDGEPDDSQKQLGAAKRVDPEADWLVLALGLYEKNRQRLQKVLAAAGLDDVRRPLVVPLQHLDSMLPTALPKALDRTPDERLRTHLAHLMARP